MARVLKEYPDQATLKRLLSYDPESGVFTRIGSSSSRKLRQDRINSPAGSIPKSGYVVIWIGRKYYTGHRLAFIYMTGSVPDFIDHIDQDRSNNSWSNLRPCTHSQNSANRGGQVNSKSGLKGVYVCGKSGVWIAQITVRRKQIKLGRFKSAEEASAAYEVAAKQHFGEFAKV